MKNSIKFKSFVESLQTEENSKLLSSILEAYDVISEGEIDAEDIGSYDDGQPESTKTFSGALEQLISDDSFKHDTYLYLHDFMDDYLRKIVFPKLKSIGFDVDKSDLGIFDILGETTSDIGFDGIMSNISEIFKDTIHRAKYFEKYKK